MRHVSPRRPGPRDGHSIKKGNDSPISPLLAPSWRPPLPPPLPPRTLINFQTNLFIAGRRLSAQVTAAPNGSFISPPRSTDFALTLRGKKSRELFIDRRPPLCICSEERSSMVDSSLTLGLSHFALQTSSTSLEEGCWWRRWQCGRGAGRMSPLSQSEGWTFDSPAIPQHLSVLRMAQGMTG